MLLTLDEGKELVKLARKSIEYYSVSGTLPKESTSNKKFAQERGVFVTLEKFPSKELRGCIGYPYASKPLWNAVADAAIQAAFNDTRFGPLKTGELENIVLEVSVLTEPKEIRCEKAVLPSQVTIGTDGLIAQKGARSGLLLPQVALEQKWDSKTFLNEVCIKALLPEIAWKQADTKIYKFQAQIFFETSPNGEIEEKRK
ncbi:MAG: TIGR00296 family protein [Candidatus Diapherotrites archaeon]|nr:TIGR00296 family protein [Candidatus Diapherotrites archaeon]